MKCWRDFGLGNINKAQRKTQASKADIPGMVSANVLVGFWLSSEGSRIFLCCAATVIANGGFVTKAGFVSDNLYH